VSETVHQQEAHPPSPNDGTNPKTERTNVPITFDGSDVEPADPPVVENNDNAAERDDPLDEAEHDASDVSVPSASPVPPRTLRIDDHLFNWTCSGDHFDGEDVAVACHAAGFDVVPLGKIRRASKLLPDAARLEAYVAANVTSLHGKVVAQRGEGGQIRVISWMQWSARGHYKRPACKGWQTMAFDRSWWGAQLVTRGDREWLDCSNRLRLAGIRTGNGLVVIDIDVKDRKNGFLALIDRFGERVLELFPPTFSVATPSGGMHLYYRISERVGNAPLAPGVDIRGDGGLVVAPGCIGVNGLRYQIENLVEPAVLPDEAVAILLALGKRSVMDDADDIPGEWQDMSVAERRKRASKYLAKMPPAIQGENGSGACFKAAIAMVRGFALPIDDALEILRTEYSPRCEPPWSEEELRHKVEDGLAKGRVPMGALLKRRSKGRGSAQAGAPPSPPPGSSGAPWEQALLRSEFGKVLPWSANVDTVLANDPQWSGVLGFDELLNNVVFLGPPPADFLTRVTGDEWRDEDDTALCNWLQRTWEMCVSPTIAHAAVVLAARRKSFHPIRDEIEGTPWDGIPRVDSWLTTYLGVAQTEYSKRVGRWWLISAVARVERPGCKVDTMLILEGPQGARKSSALRLLAGDKYFLDDLGDVGNVEAKKQLRGKWIVEMAELDSMRRAEASTIKQFLSRQTDNYRPSYGRSAVDFPRQNVFAGTTNHEEYLQDETGARRFWPVRVGVIDLEALARDRAQLWAEALHLYRAGERYWPEGLEETALCGVEQDARQAEDPWLAAIAKFVAKKDSISTADVLVNCLGYSAPQIKQPDSKRVAAVLRTLGWVRARGSLANAAGPKKRRQPRVYVPGPDAESLVRKATQAPEEPLRAADFAGPIPVLRAVETVGDAGSDSPAYDDSPEPKTVEGLLELIA